MTETIGDDEPENAWHPDDTADELLDNLDRRCSILGEPSKRILRTTRKAWLHDITRRLERLQRRRYEMSERDSLRVGLIADDVEFIRIRLGD